MSKCQKIHVGYRMSDASTAVRIEFWPICPLELGARNFLRIHEDQETSERLFRLFAFGLQVE